MKTTDWGYVRLRRPDYSDAELTEWVKRVQEQGWEDTFVFFKHEDETQGSTDGRAVMRSWPNKA